MNSVPQFLNLSNPAVARDFLRTVRIGPERTPLTYFQQADGKRITIDEATDGQVVQVATEIILMIQEQRKPEREASHKIE